MGNLFEEFGKHGERIGFATPGIDVGVSNGLSYQTQNAIPSNINTPYSQIIDDDELKPSNASRVTGGRLYDAVCSPYENSGADFIGNDSIQKAINAGKKRIFIRNGIYLISSTINILSSDISLTGEDKYGTILKIINNNGLFRIFKLGASGNKVTNINITNICFDGNSSTIVGTGNMAITLFYCSDINIFNNYFLNIDRYGIDSYATNTEICHNINIYDNVFNDVDGSIAISGYGATVDETKYTYSNIIARNFFYSSSATISAISGSSVKNCIFSNNIVVGGLYGLYFNYSRRNIISNNIIRNTYTAGAIFLNGNLNLITNNIIKNINKYGLQLSGSSRNSVNGNIFYNNSQLTNNTYFDIYLNEDDGNNSTYNVLSSNQFYADGVNKVKYHISEIDILQDYNLISNNIMSGFSTSALNLFGANDVVGDNII